MSGSSKFRAVAVGGGSGIPATLDALLSLGFETSAVVAMADDGGSTGLLRKHTGVIPPGDIRNCLVAMARDPHSPMAQAMQYRLPHPGGGALHAVGNLLLVALAQVKGSFPEAITELEHILDTRGHVYPSTLEDIALCAVNRQGAEFCGQVVISGSLHPLERVWTEPQAPEGYEPALDALRAADLIVLGPGSLYTSVIPNLLVDGFIEALDESSALVVAAINVANQPGETHGLDAAEHVRALVTHGLGGRLDAVVIQDPGAVCDDCPEVEFVRVDGDIVAAIESTGVKVFIEPLIDAADPIRHSRALLASALEKVWDTCRSPLK